MSLTEADTCRKFVVPQLQAAGWDNEPHSIAEQRTITDGRIVPVGKGFVRKPPKRERIQGVQFLIAQDGAASMGLAVRASSQGFTTRIALVSGFPFSER